MWRGKWLTKGRCRESGLTFQKQHLSVCLRVFLLARACCFSKEAGSEAAASNWFLLTQSAHSDLRPLLLAAAWGRWLVWGLRYTDGEHAAPEGGWVGEALGEEVKRWKARWFGLWFADSMLAGRGMAEASGSSMCAFQEGEEGLVGSAGCVWCDTKPPFSSPYTHHVWILAYGARKAWNLL